MTLATHTVRFCAIDTSGNQTCTDTITFNMLGGYVQTGGGGSGGGSGDFNQSGNASGTGQNGSQTPSGSTAGLGWVNASADLTWLYGVEYPVQIRIYDADGKPYDTPLISADVLGNASGTQGQFHRLGRGVYEKGFTITQAGGDKVIISVQVVENGRTASSSRSTSWNPARARRSSKG